MSTSLDEICPRYIGEDRLVLQLQTIGAVRAFEQVAIAVDYSATAPEGVVLPLELLIQGPSPQSYVYRVFRRSKPTTLIFTPREGGSHLITLREFAHNKWWGRLVVSVDGQPLQEPRAV